MTDRTIYLDNASTTWPKPPQVARAMAEFLERGAATPGRGGYAMATRNAETVGRLRARLGDFLNAESEDRVVLTPGATDSFNIALLGLFCWRSFATKPKVVTTLIEHNAIRRPLLFLQQQGVLDLIEVRSNEQGMFSPESILSAVDDRTVLVALTAASNMIGTILPSGEVCRTLRAKRPDILTVVDASQTAGIIDIDVQRDCIDLLGFPGHKSMLGPTGTGILYVSPRASGEVSGASLRLEPMRFGGTGGDSGSDSMPKAMPARFEPGSANTVGFIGLLAAMESPDRPTPEAALRHERALVARIIKGISRHDRVKILGPAGVESRVGVVSFTVDGWEPTELGQYLDSRHGICVRAGLHCAPGAHKSVGTFARAGAVRASPGVYNNERDVDAFIAAIDEAVKA